MSLSLVRRNAVVALILLILAALLSGCASGELRAINRIATQNAAALSSTAAIYDAARNPRIDASSYDFVNDRVSSPVTRANLGNRNTEDVGYLRNLSTLREHGQLLAAYFNLIAEYTAPGSKSATKLTDAQLAGSDGIIAAIEELGGGLDEIASTGVTLALTEVSRGSLRRNFEAHGPVVAEGLRIQEEAIQALSLDLAQNRHAACEDALRVLENAFAPADAGRVVPPGEIQQFIDRRRAAVGCTRGASDARQVHEALQRGRASFLAILEGEARPHDGASASPEDPERVRLGVAAEQLLQRAREARESDNRGE